jgi:hypothetical protein
MSELQKNLLHFRRWSDDDELDFHLFVSELIKNWFSVTDTRLTPKCHMVLHVVSFVKEHHYLARYGESQMESYHGKFSHTEQIHHSNKGSDVCERLRSTLADKSLGAVSDFL